MNELRKIVVSNSTPLIYLSKVGRLNIIKDVFGKIFIPEAVFNEAVVQGKMLKISDAFIIEKAVGDWILREQVKPEISAEFSFLDTNTKLGPGEKEALKLCKQLNAEFFIVDDREARRVSKILRITPVGTFGVIIQAFRQNSITKNEALKTLDDLIKAGLRIDSTLYRMMIEKLE
ncbi:MAG: DUF3368 domain-containing protein [Thermoproteota archaeon]|nr:DUF3368 domain-containing protein [Candidatus Brockarchaeota archaeon]